MAARTLFDGGASLPESVELTVELPTFWHAFLRLGFLVCTGIYDKIFGSEVKWRLFCCKQFLCDAAALNPEGELITNA